MALPYRLKGVPPAQVGALRKHCEARLQALDVLREPWLTFTRAVVDELMPDRRQFLIDPTTQYRGGQQNTHVCDAVGHLALSTSSAALMSESMPPTSAWLKLVVKTATGHSPDDDLRLFSEMWSKTLLDLHNQSNANNAFPEPIKEGLGLGTGAVLLDQDDERGIRIDPLTAGQYWIADDANDVVDTIYRRFTWTVAQVVDEFGFEQCSPTVQEAYTAVPPRFDDPVTCVHAIEPDRDGKNPRPSPEHRWRSVYYEETAGCESLLAVRGFRRFPALVWRWGKRPGSPYGYGLGHEVLPHLVRLRQMILRYGQAMAFQALPPTQGPAVLNQHEHKVLPGARVTVFGQQKISNLFDVPLKLGELAEEIENTRQQIRDVLGETRVASLRRITQQMTKAEAEIRKSEDLGEWLPGIFRLHDELHRPYVEWLWDVAQEAGMIELPEAIEDGSRIDVELISPLALRQRQPEADAVVRTWAIAGEMAKTNEEVLDNLDANESIRFVAEVEGTPARVMVPLAKVRALQEARRQRQLAEMQAAAAQQGVDVAKGVAETERLTRSA